MLSTIIGAVNLIVDPTSLVRIRRQEVAAAKDVEAHAKETAVRQAGTYVGETIASSMVGTSLLYAAVGGLAGWYFYKNPWVGAGIGAATGAALNLSYQGGRLVGYNDCEVKHQLAEKPGIIYLGQRADHASRPQVTSGLRDRLAAARKR